MVPEHGAVADRPSARAMPGANGDKRGALFTIGGFWRRCEKIGGHIGGVQALRNGATIADVPGYSASVPEPRARAARALRGQRPRYGFAWMTSRAFRRNIFVGASRARAEPSGR
ncbi:hypothetical protein WT53_21650 [Burkholderia sp. MSMB2157WGS]|nr:hypothetical protein WT53_21650 [Burkholderia sp. MSMB2157WGS]